MVGCFNRAVPDSELNVFDDREEGEREYPAETRGLAR